MYKTINGWTKEAMKSQIRLKNNGRKALGTANNCVYRTKDGNACAAGCFIPDEHEAACEYQGLVDTLEAYLRRYNHPPVMWPLSVGGMHSMQLVHDTALKVPVEGNILYVPFVGHAASAKDMRDLLCDWIDANVTDDPSYEEE